MMISKELIKACFLNGKSLLVVLFLLPFLGIGQVKMGAFNFPSHKGTHQGFVMSDSSVLYGIQYARTAISGEQNLFMNTYDLESFELKESFNISPPPEMSKLFELKQIFSLGGKMILVMVETLEADEKRISLQVIRKNGEREKPIPLDTLPSADSRQNDFEITVDKEELSFVICTNYPISINQKQQLKISSYNSKLEKQWTKNIQFPDRNKQFLFSDWQYDGGSRVFFLARYIVDLFETQAEPSTRKQNSYHLWNYDHQKGQVKEIELSLNDRFIGKLNMAYQHNQCVVAGLFANDGKFKTDGVFNLVLDSNFQKVNHWIHTFTLKERMTFNRTNLAVKTTRGIDDLQLKGLEILSDGSFVLLGEEFRKEIEQPVDVRMNPTNFNETYYYNDITLFWFNQEGKNLNMYSLPKTQVSLNDNGQYSSFHVSNEKNQLWIWYNDHPKNLKIFNLAEQKIKTTSSSGKIYLRLVKIDQNGVLNAEEVLPPSRIVRVRPQFGAKLLNGNTYFLVEKRRKRAVIEIKGK
ncbi:MAG: hypothetical protein KJ941_03045 [Bacteroidetes bacterium]|nr:hypothetical protein [Bacteroidota bacterium]